MKFDDVPSPNSLPPPPPGNVLRDEFMHLAGLSARALADEIGVPPNRITTILNGTRSITAATAVKLAERFENSPWFWMKLQVAHDLAVAEQDVISERRAAFDRLATYRASLDRLSTK